MSAPNAEADALARAAAQAMWAEDAASRAAGYTLEHAAEGRARLSGRVTEAMVNGHGTCHGGHIFTLADSAFAFACNSYNERAVAQHASITFVAPAREGDRLIADAEMRARFGRSGICDVRVTREVDGALIAEFRGHSRVIGGALVETG